MIRIMYGYPRQSKRKISLRGGWRRRGIVLRGPYQLAAFLAFLGVACCLDGGWTAVVGLCLLAAALVTAAQGYMIPCPRCGKSQSERNTTCPASGYVWGT